MDLMAVNGIITVFGLIGLGIWTIISSHERAQKESNGEQFNQFFTLLLFRGLVFGITYAVAISLADHHRYYFLAIPALIAGGLYINHLGKKE